MAALTGMPAGNASGAATGDVVVAGAGSAAAPARHAAAATGGAAAAPALRDAAPTSAAAGSVLAAGGDDALDALRVAFGGLLGAERRLRGREGQCADELSIAHYRLLTCLLDAAGGLPAGRLAAAADLTPATTTQMLDVLEKRGFVLRERHATDRRVVVATLTPEGRRLTDERRTHFRALWDETFGDLSPAELATGIDVLGRVAHVLEVLAERRAGRSAAAPLSASA